MRHCGLASLRGFSADERQAWRRLAPILALLDIGAWTHDERRELIGLARAKGGRSERDYVLRYQALPKLDAALWQLLRKSPRRLKPASAARSPAG